MVEWWNAHTAGMVGGIAGATCGVLGGVVGTLMGVLAPRGKAKPLVIGMVVLMAVVGVIALCTGIAALSMGQPYHVWYPLALVGLIMTIVGGSLVFVVQNLYRAAERRKLDAEQIRRGT